MFSIRTSSFCWFSSFVLFFCSSYVMANQTSLSWTNFTLCVMNHTLSDNFAHVIDGYVAFPLVTFLLAPIFSTTAAWLDAASLAGLAYAAHEFDSIFLMVVFVTLGAFFFFKAVVGLVRNILALRYGCTRRTNFLVTDHGIVPHKSPALVVIPPSTAVVDGVKYKFTKVVQQGQLAHPIDVGRVEVWG
nr:MAG: putative glycoprotein 4 [Wufeng rodent arterivirus 1]